MSFASACSVALTPQPEASEGSILSQPLPTTTPEPSSLYLLREEPVPLRNGQAVPLGDGVDAEVFLAPYPPVGLSAKVDSDIYLVRDTGEPIPDGAVTVVYDMLTMTHGPFEVAFENLGNGHYLATLDFLMFGAWRLDFTIETPEGGRYTLPLAVIVRLPTGAGP